jgi:hypothetical protein
VSVHYVDLDINLARKSNLNEPERRGIDSLIINRPDVFIFFQEHDTLMLILSSHFAKKGTEVYLYEEGLKPYANLRFHSLGLIKDIHQENLWLRRNGFMVPSWFSPIFSKKYAFRKGISKLYLSYPETYNNWNKKAIEKIDLLPVETLNSQLKILFRWDDLLLPEKENIILYMNQPMKGNDARLEVEFLCKLIQRYPFNHVYIKLHPNTVNARDKLELYKAIKQITVIDSILPAELFTMNIKRSIILSIYSTAMFLHNPENKYFYSYLLFKNELKRLRRMQLKKVPAPHITAINSIEEINF